MKLIDVPTGKFFKKDDAKYTYMMVGRMEVPNTIVIAARDESDDGRRFTNVIHFHKRDHEAEVTILDDVTDWPPIPELPPNT